jgi:hypothetical protein
MPLLLTGMLFFYVTCYLSEVVSVEGHPTRLIKLQDEYKDEYKALTKEEHEKLTD